LNRYECFGQPGVLFTLTASDLGTAFPPQISVYYSFSLQFSVYFASFAAHAHSFGRSDLPHRDRVPLRITFDAELHLMARDKLEMFFKESGKDVTCDAVRALIEQLVSQQQQQQQQHMASPALLNLYASLLHILRFCIKRKQVSRTIRPIS
jgi:hypothetical protein